jgi:hypothetical protein
MPVGVLLIVFFMSFVYKYDLHRDTMSCRSMCSCKGLVSNSIQSMPVQIVDLNVILVLVV